MKTQNKGGTAKDPYRLDADTWKDVAQGLELTAAEKKNRGTIINTVTQRMKGKTAADNRFIRAVEEGKITNGMAVLDILMLIKPP